MARVTVVVNDRPGGSETFLASFVTALVRAGHELTVLALRPTGRPPAVVDERVAWAEGLPALRSPRAPGALLRLVGRDGAAVRDAVQRVRRRDGPEVERIRAVAAAAPLLATRPDVVHFTFSGIAVALEPALDLLDGCRLVTSCRGSAELLRPLVDPDRALALGRVLPRMDAVHVVSEAMAATAIGLGAPRERVGVVRPAVDLELFPPRPVPSPERSSVLLVAVGRLSAVKGHDDLVSAVALLRARGLDVRLTIVGEGPHRDALEARAHLLGVAGHVEVVGGRTPAEVAWILSTADLFVSASLSEGISNALLEAMATGVAVVATNVGGTGEVLTDGRDGVLVDAGDPSAVAGAVAALARDPERRDRLARAGRRRVEAAFSLDTQRTDWARFYSERVLWEPSRRRARSEEGR